MSLVIDSQYVRDSEFVKNRLTQFAEAVLKKLSEGTVKESDWSGLTSSYDPILFEAHQEIWNSALSNRYFSLNESYVIDQLENITSTSESNKIITVHIYGALVNMILKSNHTESLHLFKLAYAIKKQSENMISARVDNYAGDYFRNLVNELPGCVRSIVFLSPRIGFLIKNVKYGEYIYKASHNKDWRSTPSDLDPASYSPIFAWVPKTMDNTGKFFLEYGNNNKFWIKKAFDLNPNICVDTSHRSNVHLVECRDRSPLYAVTILPSQTYPDHCYIQNEQTENYMYAGSDETKEDAQRRAIFSNGKRSTRDTSYLWNFRPFRDVN